MYQRKRQALQKYRGPPRKTRRTTAPRSGGLVPTYRGWTPRSFTRGEWKYLDTTINTACDTTGSMTLVNGLQPGTGASQRIGMKVMLRSMELSLVNSVPPVTGTDQNHRFLVLLDRQCNGAAPTALTDFLTPGNYLGMRSLVNRRRFKIILDKRCSLNASGEPGSDRLWKFYIKFRRPIIVEFNAGVAGTIADIVTNSLYIISVGQAAAGVGAGTLLGYCRIRYTDM